MVGATISRYRVEARLGSGGMGEVYRAEDLRLRRRVALKVIRPDTVDAQAADRLLTEARAASALSHPNIAVIYEVDEATVDGLPIAFIVMELVEGRTLADLARSGELAGPAVLDIGRQIADALAAAHERGLVHRDIKPTNLMMTGTGLIKVLDFGVAYRGTHVAATDDTTRTEDWLGARGFIGTLPYVAPEQATGRDVDGRADMFSLGVVLYELLAGTRPFQGDTPLQTFEALLKDDPPPLRPARWSRDDPRLPRVEPIIRRMLEKDRAQRYASLRDVAAALRAIETSADAAPDEDYGGRAPSLAVMGFSNISGSPEDDWLGTGIAETLAADLSRLESIPIIGRERVHELLRTLAEQFPERGPGLFLRAGRELRVRWILNGAFQRTTGAIRVTASLTDVATSRIVRTVKVDGRLDAIFDVQDQVVRELVEGLKAVAAAAAPAAAAGAGAAPDAQRSAAGARAEAAPAPASIEEKPLVEAYEAFSKGMINLRVESYESLDRAVVMFERAVRLDPTYARAYVELASAYLTKAEYLAIPELRGRALDACRRAIELRPDWVRAWRELGATLVGMGRQQEGLEALHRAHALDPQDPSVLASIGRALFIGEGRFRDAADYYDRALEQNPRAGWAALQLAHCAALARELARGEAAAQRAVALQESFLSGSDTVVLVGAYTRLGHLAALQDRHAEAVDHFQRELDFLGRVDHALRNRSLVELNMRLGASNLALGHERKAQVALDIALEAFERRVRLGADDAFTRYYAACVHALRGETSTALAFLERAAAERPALTRARARIEPEFAPMRNDTRFVRFLDDARRTQTV